MSTETVGVVISLLVLLLGAVGWVGKQVNSVKMETRRDYESLRAQMTEIKSDLRTDYTERIDLLREQHSDELKRLRDRYHELKPQEGTLREAMAVTRENTEMLRQHLRGKG